MATTKMSLRDSKDFVVVRRKIEREKWTHLHVSEFLIRRYPGVCGFSVRSIERFCADNNIHRTIRLNDAELDDVVSRCVRMVCLS